MGAEEYGKSKRAHWGIENSLHWELDIGFREDESQIRAGNAAENINVLHHIGINLLKREKSCKLGMASKRKKCGYDLDYLYKVLGGLNTGIIKGSVKTLTNRAFALLKKTLTIDI